MEQVVVVKKELFDRMRELILQMGVNFEEQWQEAHEIGAEINQATSHQIVEV